MEADQLRKKIARFAISVRDEVERIKSGESQYVVRPIHFDKGISPALNTLKIFEARPSKKH